MTKISRKPYIAKCPKCLIDAELLEVEDFGMLCSRCIIKLARDWPEQVKSESGAGPEARTQS